ncbi:VRR-NUC domain-containing protein [Rickettsiales bacterium LUAb2]
MLEKQIESKVCEYAKKKGWWVAKFCSPSNRGVPDRILLKNGKVLFMEFKSSVGKLSPLQQHKINEMCNLGAEVYVVNDIEYGKSIINHEQQAENRTSEAVSIALNSLKNNRWETL